MDKTTVRYIGRRAEWRDCLYDSGLVFVAEQERAVPTALAAKLLKHPDVFVAGSIDPQAEPELDDTDEKIAEAAEKAAKQQEETDTLADVKQQVMLMEKADLNDFCERNFQQTIDKRVKLDDSRARVLQLIDQFGVIK